MCFLRHLLLLQRSPEYVKLMFHDLLQFAYLRINGSLAVPRKSKARFKTKRKFKGRAIIDRQCRLLWSAIWRLAKPTNRFTSVRLCKVGLAMLD